MMPSRWSLRELAAHVTDGARVAIPPDYSGCAMAAVAEIVDRGARNLHLLGVPSGGMQADWLIGAGCVASVEAAAMTLGEHGVPPRFASALRNGRITMRDSTCPAIHAGLQAAEKGIPFMPLRGILGSDLLRHRPEWKVIDNPYVADRRDPVVLIPPIRPDIALFHAPLADTFGNVFIGVRRELMLMAHAATQTYVTVEEITEDNLLGDKARAGATIPSLYVSAITLAPRGAAPVGLAGYYPPDEVAIRRYFAEAHSPEGFARWWRQMRAEAVPA